MATPTTGAVSSIGGTALPLAGSSTLFNHQVRLKAATGNGSEVIYVGKSTVTAASADATDGYELKAGEWIDIPVAFANDLADIYVVGSSTGLAVYFITW